jgi:hypothetical protein
MNKAFTHRVSADIIDRASAMSPTDKIRWLAQAKRFVFKNVSSEKLAKWQKHTR